MKADLKPFIVFLLAGNYAQAEHYARMYLHHDQPFTYIDSAWHLRGLRGMHVVRCGAWQRRPDLPEVVEALQASGGIDITGEMPHEHAE